MAGSMTLLEWRLVVLAMLPRPAWVISKSQGIQNEFRMDSRALQGWIAVAHIQLWWWVFVHTINLLPLSSGRETYVKHARATSCMVAFRAAAACGWGTDCDRELLCCWLLPLPVARGQTHRAGGCTSVSLGEEFLSLKCSCSGGQREGSTDPQPVPLPSIVGSPCLGARSYWGMDLGVWKQTEKNPWSTRGHSGGHPSKLPWFLHLPQLNGDAHTFFFSLDVLTWC